MGIDRFKMDGDMAAYYRFPVFSQAEIDTMILTNDEISFYPYTLPAHTQKLLKTVLSRHTHDDISKQHSAGWFDGGGKKRRRPRKSQKKRRQTPKPDRRRPDFGSVPREDRISPTVPPIHPIVGQPEINPAPRGALSWGDAAKLAAANIAGVVAAEGMGEAFEDD
jgi:hypothetical protein